MEMINLSPKKRKLNKATLKEEESTIAIDFEEETKEETVTKSEKLKENINEVKAKEGMIGYILRNANSASIDLKDPTRIIDYAVLSSSTLEASQELSDTFELGDVKHILVEGNTAKLFSFTVEDNKISLFMEKKVDHNRIHRDLLS